MGSGVIAVAVAQPGAEATAVAVSSDNSQTDVQIFRIRFFTIEVRSRVRIDGRS
jgi:hypothetical protein